MEKENRGNVSAQEVAAAKAAQGGDKQRNHVIVYLSILFAICVLLIIFSLVMHQRTNAQLMQAQQSYAETVQQLKETETKYRQAQEENDSLHQQVLSLGKQTEDDERYQAALDLIWKAERLYTAGKSDACVQALQELGEDELYLLLPDDASETAEDENSRYESPRAAYERMKEHLIGEDAAETTEN